MNDSLDIKRVFGPILRNFWIVGLAVLYGMWYGKDSGEKMLKVYESRSTVKLNDQYTALTKFLEHIEAFSVIGKYTVELEVMRSDRILIKAIERMNLPLSYFQYRNENWRNQYPAAPFLVEGESSQKDQRIEIEFLNDHTFSYRLSGGNIATGQIGEEIMLPEMKFRLRPNPNCERSWQPGELYAFTFNSLEALMEDFGNGEDLLIRLQDEKVAIVNFYTWDEVPQRAADFANALANAYLEDFRETKALNSLRSRAFLDSLVEQAYRELMAAEADLLAYQNQHQLNNFSPVLNERLEQMALLLQKQMFIELDNKGLERIGKAFRSDTALLDPGLTYDVLLSDAYINGVRRLRDLALTRSRLKQRYQSNHPELEVLNHQMIELRTRVAVSVDNTYRTNEQKLRRLERESEKIVRLISEIPGIERDWIQLQRKVKASEAKYQSLLEKQAEADISAASDETYHSLLEPALLAFEALKPNPRIRIGVGGLAFGLLACILIHIYLLLSRKIRRVTDLEVHSDLPLIAEVSSLFPQADRVGKDFVNLAMRLQLNPSPTQTIGMFGPGYKEDLPIVVINLAKALGGVGQRVMVLDLDFYFPQLSYIWTEGPSPGMVDIIQSRGDYTSVLQETNHPGVDFIPAGKMEGLIPAKMLHHARLLEYIHEIQNRYDYVLLSLPVLKQGQEAWPLLKRCDICLLPVRQNRTSRTVLSKWAYLLDQHAVQNASLLFIGQSPRNPKFFRLNTH